MTRKQWLSAAGALFLGAVGATLLSYYVFLLGVFAALVVPDLFLLAASACVASLFWRRRRLAIGVAFASWVVLGINRDLPDLLTGNVRSSGLHAVTRIERELDTRALTQLSVTGDARSVIAAAGRRGDALPRVNVAGTLDGIDDLGNVVHDTDISETVWYAGLTPRIGGTSYPALHIDRTEHGNHYVLKMTMLAGPNQPTATFERTLWYPYFDRPAKFLSVVRIALSCNLWKFLLSRYPDDDPERGIEAEIEYFIAHATGRAQSFDWPRQSLRWRQGQPAPPGPLQAVRVASEAIVRYSGAGNVSAYKVGVDEQQSMSIFDGITWYAACRPDIATLEVGSPGGQLPVLAVMDGPGRELTSPERLSRGNLMPKAAETRKITRMIESDYDHQLRRIYCDSSTGRLFTLVTLSGIGVPHLRIHMYSPQWHLLGVYYLGLPAGMPKSLLFEPGTLSIAENGTIRFSLIEKTTDESGGVDLHRLRRIDLVSL